MVTTSFMIIKVRLGGRWLWGGGQSAASHDRLWSATADRGQGRPIRLSIPTAVVLAAPLRFLSPPPPSSSRAPLTPPSHTFAPGTAGEGHYSEVSDA